jgi:hypothetical protein
MKFYKEEVKPVYIEMYGKVFDQRFFDDWDEAWEETWERCDTYDSHLETIEEFCEWLCDNSVNLCSFA